DGTSGCRRATAQPSRPLWRMSWREPPVRVACAPNAHTLPVLGTVTTPDRSLSSAFAFGEGTTAHADPSQCSTRVPPASPPTAHTSRPDTAATLTREPRLGETGIASQE